jgi:hypothetical protein
MKEWASLGLRNPTWVLGLLEESLALSSRECDILKGRNNLNEPLEISDA